MNLGIKNIITYCYFCQTGLLPDKYHITLDIFAPRSGLLLISIFFTASDNCLCMPTSPLSKSSISLFFTAGQPKVVLSFGPSYVEKGKNITLPVCHVTGFPVVLIRWLKVEDNLVQARALVKDGQLSIINAKKTDSGLYKCKASNYLGHDSAVTQLNVVELPRFTMRPPAQLKAFTVENDVTVRCQATGDPQPKVTWMKENGDLPVGRSSVNDGTLKILSPKVEDSGRYFCTATSNNILAKAISTMELTVKRGGRNNFELIFRSFLPADANVK